MHIIFCGSWHISKEKVPGPHLRAGRRRPALQQHGAAGNIHIEQVDLPVAGGDVAAAVYDDMAVVQV